MNPVAIEGSVDCGRTLLHNTHLQRGFIPWKKNPVAIEGSADCGGFFITTFTTEVIFASL